MIVREGISWQTTLTDLALILFMISASALSEANSEHQRAASKTTTAAQASPRGEPLAIWRAAPGAPPLGAWLHEQPADPRQLLTILAPYRPGGQAAALALAARLAAEAGEQGRIARIIAEQGSAPATATLGYDQPEGGALPR